MRQGGIIIWALLLLMAVPATGESLQRLKEMAVEGVTLIDKDCFVEGWWLGDYASPNLDNTAPRHYSSDHSSTVRYVNYLESKDGSTGIKLRAAHKDSFRSMPRYAYAYLNLKGCTLEWFGQEKLEVSGIEDRNILYISRKTRADVPTKRKFIRELIPSDVYTLVTLKECEFPLKAGSFLNIYETYAIKTAVNQDASPNGAMNSWARMAMDSNGDRIYFLINSTVLWRRDGGRVPSGSGDAEGILVSSSLPRYGGQVLGRYQLRPLAREDISFTEPSHWKTAAAWDWTDNADAFSPGIQADEGTGSISVEPSGSVKRGKDFDNPLVLKKGADNRGTLSHSSLTINTEACNWWDWKNDCGKGIVLSVCTREAKESLVLAFSFSAGNITPASNAGYPVYWEVQVSADGIRWSTLRGTHKLRSLPWWYKNDVDGSNYLLSYEAGLGPTEHLVKLPAALLGLERAYIRIRPSEKIAASYAIEGNDNAALRPNLRTETWVNFGSIAVYSK